MPGNVLDVAMFENWIIVSVDSIHKPNSTTTIDETDVSLPEVRGRLFCHTFRG